MHENLLNHLKWMFTPKKFLYGKNLPTNINIKGFDSIIFIDKLNELKAVNQATGDLFLGGTGNEFLAALFGQQSAFTTDGEAHRMARKVVGPWLSHSRMQEKQGTVDTLISHNIDLWLKAGNKDIGHWARTTTMQIMCHVVLGINNPARIQRIFNRFELTTGYLSNIISYTRPFWKAGRLPSVGHMVEWFVRRVDKEIYAAIEETRARNIKNPETPLEGMIFAQKEHGYDDVFIRDNLVALLAAGYDTTGSALTWLFFWLGKEGDTGHSAAAYRAEVLRYCSPIEILPRKVAENRLMEACTVVPSIAQALPTASAAGPLVCPCPHRVHHKPDLYPEPEKFNPDRFENTRNRTSNEYLPFGAGSHMCIGIHLGKLVVDRMIETLRDRKISIRTNRTNFSPIRRNVSIWPGIRFRGSLSSITDLNP